MGDAIIALAFFLGRPEMHGLVVSLVSSLSLFLVAVLALTRDGMAPPETETEPPEPPEPPAPAKTGQIETDDAQIIDRLDHLKQQEQLLPEPDLTLARLVRRLRVPAKLLSAAINRQTGENVSRNVNGYRIGHACALLRDGMPVTEAIYARCFNTKSNFNREFLGAPGQSPSGWRDARATAA